jgi:hypothetical protein
LAGLANLALFLSNHSTHTARTGCMCVLLGLGYLMIMAAHPRPKL